LKKLDATVYERDGGCYLKKTCPEHGIFRSVVWKGSVPIKEWIGKKERAVIKNPLTEVKDGCPYDCGLCSEHRQHTCTALMEVTQRCNLHCRFCFADANAGEKEEPSLEQIKAWYETVKKSAGGCNIQLSGGEPTVRDDLPQIIKLGKELGFPFIQINTNGLRIAEDEEYFKALKLAGLDSVFLQFDGTEDSIYKKLRGRELLSIKIKAIENCGKHGVGVVLVPTLVSGVNADNVGKIIDFALEHIRAVRGVHFQPVSYFGRIPQAPRDEDRITLPQLMDELERQTNGRIKAANLKPAKCENPLCSFHGSFLYDPKNRELTQIAAKISCKCVTQKAEEGARKTKKYVSQNWTGRESEAARESTGADAGWDRILQSIRSNSFSISAMAFQDAWNVDLERVKDCCIHVVNPRGKLIPFCIYNITNTEGVSLYRNRK
jgi:Predicted Fe-S oxidoreductases